MNSCSQDASPRMEETDSAQYSRIPLSLGEVEAVVQPIEEFSVPVEESSARTLSLELDENNKMLPKVKEFKEGTKVLCIIRSSDSRQPVNYIEATWMKKNGTTKPTYSLSFGNTITGSASPNPSAMTFAYDSRYPLGTLSMMLITGGEWDATTKRLKVSPKLVRAVGSTMEYDMPYVSEWRPLDYNFNNGSSDPSSLQISLKDHDRTVANPERYSLKPAGMLLRMPVEEEMAEDGGGFYQLNGITIRSTAFGGQGYFNLSEANIKGVADNVITQKKNNYSSWWNFNIQSEKDETYTVANPTEHFYTAAGVTEYGTRKLKRFTPRYYLFLWVMPRGQQATDVTNGDVRTQIYADVDVKPRNGKQMVYSNASDADEKELQGYVVVPSMKALPVYASDRLVPKADGSNSAFVEGKTYPLTLNLNRPDLPLELLSQYPVNNTLTGFSKNIAEAYYVDNRTAATDVSSLETSFRTNTGQNTWSVPGYSRFSLILGTLFGKGTLDPSATTLKDDPRPGQQAKYISTDAFVDKGNYKVHKDASDIRMLLGFHSKLVGDQYATYTLLFYPSMQRNTAYNRRGDRLCILRSEYVATSPYGGPAYKLTMRYLGTYSNDIGVMSYNLPEVGDEDEQKSVVAAAVDKIIAKGDAYWNDNLRKKDDIVRYLPMCQKDPSTNMIYKSGEPGYTWGDMGCMPFNTGSITYAYYGKLGIGYAAIGASSAYSELNRSTPIFLMRDRLSHK